MSATWLDPARTLADLVELERWDECEEMLAGIAEREGLDAAGAVDDAALALLAQRARDVESDEAYGDLTAGRP